MPEENREGALEWISDDENLKEKFVED